VRPNWKEGAESPPGVLLAGSLWALLARRSPQTELSQRWREAGLVYGYAGTGGRQVPVALAGFPASSTAELGIGKRRGREQAKATGSSTRYGS
jgi:hypothetical protein